MTIFVAIVTARQMSVKEFCKFLHGVISKHPDTLVLYFSQVQRAVDGDASATPVKLVLSVPVLINDYGVGFFKALSQDNEDIQIELDNKAYPKGYRDRGDKLYLPLNGFKRVELASIRDNLTTVIGALVRAGVLKETDYVIKLDMDTEGAHKGFITFLGKNSKIPRKCEMTLRWLKNHRWAVDDHTGYFIACKYAYDDDSK